MSAFDRAWVFLKAEDASRMKRPDMLAEARGIMDELARREWNRGDKGKDEFGYTTAASLEGTSALDDYGRINFEEDEDTEHITPDMFRMTRPEMEERLLALQTELARRGRPLVGEKFTDLFESEQDPATGKDRFYMDESGEQLVGSKIAENMDLVDAMGDRARTNEEHKGQRENQALLDRLNEFEYDDANRYREGG